MKLKIHVVSRLACTHEHGAQVQYGSSAQCYVSFFSSSYSTGSHDSFDVFRPCLAKMKTMGEIPLPGWTETEGACGETPVIPEVRLLVFYLLTLLDVCRVIQGIIFPVSHRNSRCIFSHLRRIFFHESQLLRCKRNVHSYTQTANPQTTYTLDAPISDPYIPGRLG